MPQPVNPDTHCTTCGEPLSVFGHCWQHDYPPMDPSQDAQPKPSYIPCGECGSCLAHEACARIL